MILFVSGRCDIPAFYSPWFYNRLKEGFVDVRNPFNPHQLSRIYLNEQNVDCILFCTKNPIPMMNKLHEIPFPYIFHVTLTPYHQDIECNISNKREILKAVKELSSRLGKNRVIIRYDPILLTPKYTIAYHKKAFEKLCEELDGYIDHIIISFVDLYKNTKENQVTMQMIELTEREMIEIAKALGPIAKKYAIRVTTCAESIDLRSYNIEKGLCIDKKELERIVHHSLDHIKDKGVRKQCGCIQTVDIGDYNCCAHGCRYCYANYNSTLIQDRIRLHDPNSSVLLGYVEKEDHIVVREEKKVRQISFLE